MRTEKYEAGDEVTFTAQRTCQFRGNRYHAGDEMTIELNRDFDAETDEGYGDGGPWGWAGFTSRRLARIAR